MRAIAIFAFGFLFGLYLGALIVVREDIAEARASAFQSETPYK